MNPPDVICGKCGGAMGIGAIADFAHGSSKQSRWVGGEPKETFWSGLQTGDRAQFKVATYRCESCGYLESYALEETDDSF